MTAVYCNRCGQVAGTGSAMCAVCGAPLEGRADPPTSWALRAVDAHLSDLPRDQLETLVAARPSHVGQLVIIREPDLASRFELDLQVTTVGRDSTADVILDDVTVSRRHGEFRRIGGSDVVIDLDSLNGTYLNGSRVERAALEEGDHLQIGKFRLLYFAPGDKSAGCWPR